MKLKELYIENFGGLHQYALNFDAGITTVVEPNGFGKTTLAEFIRAMFYGFPRKSKTLEKSLRQKYTPWNGGQFGGNLTFEYERRCYRVERTFGTNPKGDTFAVIDLETGRKTDRFPEELGQALFGLDGESFERSTYLPQMREPGSLTTAAIQAKLSNLVEGSADVAGFEKAMAVLRAKRSGLLPYRGGAGDLAETASEITRLQLKQDMLREKENQLKAAMEETNLMQRVVDSSKESLERICEQLQEASRQETDMLRQQQYHQLQERHSKVLDRLYASQQKYPRGLPREDALRRAELAAERLKQQEKQETAMSARQLEHCRENCAAYEELQSRLRELGLRQGELTRAEMIHGETKPVAPLVLLLLALVGIAVGAVMAVLLEMSNGLVLLGAGILALVFAVLLYGIQKAQKRSRNQKTAEARAEIQRKIREVNEAAEICRRELTANFADFGLRVEPQEFTTALEALERRTIRAGKQNQEILETREELSAFFAELGHPMPQRIEPELAMLREDLRERHGLQTLERELAEQLAAMEESCGDILFAEFAPDCSPRQLRQEEQRLRAELMAATTRMLQAQQQVRQLQAEIAPLPDVTEQLEQAQQRLAEDRETVRILDATMDFLQQAREDLATAYMGTIRTRFGYYLSQLFGSGESYLIDASLQVQLVRQGQARELAYFSAGQADLVMLCMRFALADALYGTQEMFLILDDPFVNLDDTHMEQARQLLQKVAAERQILYLSCHSSRAM